MLKLKLSKSPNSFPNIWDTIAIKFVAKNFQKSPNLVALQASGIDRDFSILLSSRRCEISILYEYDSCLLPKVAK